MSVKLKFTELHPSDKPEELPVPVLDPPKGKYLFRGTEAKLGPT